MCMRSRIVRDNVTSMRLKAQIAYGRGDGEGQSKNDRDEPAKSKARGVATNKRTKITARFRVVRRQSRGVRRWSVPSDPAPPHVLEGFRNRLSCLDLLLPQVARTFCTDRKHDGPHPPTELNPRRPVEGVRRRERGCTDDVTDSSYRCENLRFPT